MDWESCQLECETQPDCLAYEWTSTGMTRRCSLKYGHRPMELTPVTGTICRLKPMPGDVIRPWIAPRPRPPPPPPHPGVITIAQLTAVAGGQLEQACPIKPASASASGSSAACPCCSVAGPGADFTDPECAASATGLAYADLRGADLQGAKFEIATIGTIFDGANLKGASFTNNGKGASFKGADLRQAKMDGAMFENADFHGADLREATIQDSNFDGANFACIKGEKLMFKGGNKLVKTSFKHAQLTGTIFENNQLNEADFRNANLKGVIISSDVTAADFSHATGVCDSSTDMSQAHGTARCDPVMVNCQVRLVDPGKCQ